MRGLMADAGLLDVNGTLIAEVVAFILMVLVLAKWVYPPIMRIATEREKKIEAGVRAAEDAQKRLLEVQEQVEKTLDEARSQARDIVGRAHREATVEAEEVRVKGRAEGEALVERARTEIAAERDRAGQELRTEVGNLVVDAASRVIGETIDRTAHQRLIDEALAQVGDGGAYNGRAANKA
jgi:F-type H+-transporting ATPase subunit b